MKYGIMIFATDYGMHPADIGREVETRGFDSLWFPEHSHIPASRKSPAPGGGELPEQYWHTHDLFIALSAAATATNRINIATGICLIVQRDPIITAKEVATLDVLSGGRVIFGIGGGWNAEEMANHGTDFSHRWKIMRERVLAMKEIWAKDEAEYHGEFVNFDKLWSYPKPHQKPHPPIMMGGDGPKTFERVIEYCDGWVPVVIDPPSHEKKIKELREKAEHAGRGSEISVTSIIPAALATEESVETLKDSGTDRIVIGVAPGKEDTVLPALDKFVKLTA